MFALKPEVLSLLLQGLDDDNGVNVAMKNAILALVEHHCGIEARNIVEEHLDCCEDRWYLSERDTFSVIDKVLKKASDVFVDEDVLAYRKYVYAMFFVKYNGKEAVLIKNTKEQYYLYEVYRWDESLEKVPVYVLADSEEAAICQAFSMKKGEAYSEYKERQLKSKAIKKPFLIRGWGENLF